MPDGIVNVKRTDPPGATNPLAMIFSDGSQPDIWFQSIHASTRPGADTVMSTQAEPPGTQLPPNTIPSSSLGPPARSSPSAGTVGLPFDSRSFSAPKNSGPPPWRAPLRASVVG